MRLGQIRLLAVLMALGGLLFQFTLIPVEAQAQTAPSPTGGTPLFMWTPEWQANWQRAKAEYEAGNQTSPTTTPAKLYHILKTNAECLGGCRYGDIGQWGAFMFQITGDPKYVTAAMARIDLNSQLTAGNGTRAGLAFEVLMFNWLFPGLSQTQRDAWTARMNRNVAVVEGRSFSGTDSDQTSGDYFGMAMWYVWTKDTNPTIKTAFEKPDAAGVPTWARWGGLTPTGTDYSTARNAINKYAKDLAMGGQWIETTDYNMGTIPLFVIGRESLRTALGRDNFPEYDPIYKELALGQIHEISNDQATVYKWGDAGGAAGLHLDRRIDLLGMLSGVNEGDANVGPYVQQFLEDMFTKHGLRPRGPAEPWGGIFFLSHNPYAAKKDWRTLGKTLSATGVGLFFQRHDWGNSDTVFAAHFPRPFQVDHQPDFAADFRLHRKGEWAITHPVDVHGPTYANPTSGFNGEGNNTMIIGGNPGKAEEIRGPVAWETGANNSYGYYAGTAAGSYFGKSYFGPPPVYLHEWTRSYFYLPSSDKKSDVVVMYDRTNADDPTSDIPKYHAAHRPLLTKGLTTYGLKSWLLHTVGQPTVTSSAIDYTTPGGQEVHIDTHLPTSRQSRVVDENAVWDTSVTNPPHPCTLIPGECSKYPSKDQLKWHVVLTPPAQQWDTFLNVIQARDAGTQTSSSLIKSDAGHAVEGTLVKRAGQNDTVVLFSAKPGSKIPTAWATTNDATVKKARLIDQPYSISVSPTAGQTDIYAVDLDTTKTWEATVNGVKQNLTLSANGLSHFTVSGSGAKTISIAPSGSAPLPTPSPSPSAARANLTLTKSVDKTTATVGDTLTYTLTYTNTGAAATNVVVTDSLPTNTSLVPGSITNGGLLGNGLMTWTVGAVAAGGSGSLTFKVTVL